MIRKPTLSTWEQSLNPSEAGLGCVPAGGGAIVQRICTQHVHLRMSVKPAADELQGYLAHKKQRPPRTLQKDVAWDPMVVLGWGAVSYERGTPAARPCSHLHAESQHSSDG